MPKKIPVQPYGFEMKTSRKSHACRRRSLLRHLVSQECRFPNVGKPPLTVRTLVDGERS